MKTGRKSSSSTDDQIIDDRIKKLFVDYIMPESERLKSLPDPYGIRCSEDVQSYFEEPRHPKLVSHQLMDLDSEEEMVSRLSDMWRDSPNLLAMIPEMAKLALELRSGSEDQSADLDSFIYVMY
jgi:hypothetical protein